MSAVIAVLLVIGVFMVVIVGAGIFATVTAAKRVTRSTRTRVEGLKLKAGALPGRPGREVAALRVRLRESLAQTQAVMASPAFVGAPECVQMAGLLHQATHALDHQLNLLEREPSADLRRRYLDVLTPRAVRVIEDATALRDTVYSLGLHLPNAGYDARADLRDRIDGLAVAVRELTQAGPRA